MHTADHAFSKKDVFVSHDAIHSMGKCLCAYVHVWGLEGVKAPLAEEHWPLTDTSLKNFRVTIVEGWPAL